MRVESIPSQPDIRITMTADEARRLAKILFDGNVVKEEAGALYGALRRLVGYGEEMIG